jgi:DNA-binding FadR family transcriptional regulator
MAKTVSERVGEHRQRLRENGMVHLSLVVPADEADFFREMARLVRERKQHGSTYRAGKKIERTRLTAAQLQLAERWATRSGLKLRLSRPGLSFSEVLARNIAHEMAIAGWPIGANFGTEQDLLQRYEVSRGVLREAIRLLEALTVAVMRRGPSGGLIVAQPSLESGSVPSGVFLSSRRLSLDDLLAARRLLEPYILGCCFDRFDESSQQLLKQHLLFESQLDETASGPDLQHFHILLARITGNPSMELFMDILLRMTRFYSRYYREGKSERQKVVSVVRQAHAAIARALFAGDRERGLRALNDYLEHHADWM